LSVAGPSLFPSLGQSTTDSAIAVNYKVVAGVSRNFRKSWKDEESLFPKR
jgi:hypothetical protein